MGEQTALLCRRIPNHLCSYSPLKEAEADPVTKVWVVNNDYIPKCTVGGGRRKGHCGEKLTNAHSAVVKVKISRAKSRG